MAESRQPCPFCERPVGGVHADECSRSRATLARGRRVSYILKQIRQRNFIWVSSEVIEGRDMIPPRKTGLYRVVTGGTRRKGQRDKRAPEGRVVHAMHEMIAAAQRDEEAGDAPA